MRQNADERVAAEEGLIYAQGYYTVLVLTAVVTAVMLFLDRTFVIYIPIIIAAGGSLLFMLVRYAVNGALFGRMTDERIESMKIQTKVLCFWYSLAVYIGGGAVMAFVFPDKHAAGLMIFIWFISAVAVIVQTVRKRLPRSVRNKKRVTGFRIASVVSALVFAVPMPWIIGGFDEPLAYISAVFGMAAAWGFPFYFVMMGMSKRSEKESE
jgi:hypothetical protein